MSMVTEIPGERTISWRDLSESERDVVVKVHAMGIPGSREGRVLRLFNLGQPKIVFGPEMKYCRIHAESADVMKLIFREYLCRMSRRTTRRPLSKGVWHTKPTRGSCRRRFNEELEVEECEWWLFTGPTTKPRK